MAIPCSQLRAIGRATVLTALLFSLATGLTAADTTSAAPFTSAKIVDMSGEVTIAPYNDLTNKQPAKLQEVFSAPDFMDTGRRSHVELKADDGTIARVGSNTAFSLETDSRTIHLKQGSILFNSPKGMGGGTIVTNSATATVLGTTIIVAATSNGGFKILVLEGHASVTYPNGQVVNLGPGQMTFVLPGTTGGSSSSSSSSSSGGSSSGGSSSGGTPGPVLNFDLSRETAGSGLINGFSIVLPSDNLIVDATHTQQLQISNGQFTQTNQAVIGAVNSTQVLLVDQSTLAAATQTNPANNNNNEDQLTQAEQSSLTYSPTSGFPSTNIFNSPVVFSASQFGIPNGTIKNDQLSITGIIAGDIGLGGNVDLSQLSGLSEVDLFAVNTHTFTFTGNTVFAVANGTSKLGVYSAGSFVIPSNISITLDVITSGCSYDLAPVEFDLGTVGGLALNQNVIENDFGDISLSTVLGSLTTNATTVQAQLQPPSESSYSQVEMGSTRGDVVVAGNSTLNAASEGEISVHAGGNVTIQNSTLLLGNSTSDEHYGNIDLASLGMTNVTGSSLYSGNLSIMGGSTATLDSTSLSYCYTSDLQMGAATVILSNVSIPGDADVYLWSATGELNVVCGNEAPVTGDINFVGRVRYDGENASDWIGEGIYLGITADNTGVQAALAQSFTLPVYSDSLSPLIVVQAPDDLIFDQVMFTPANLAAYAPDANHDPFIFPGGLIVGNLVINGDSEAEATAVMAQNYQITASGNVEVYDGSELDLYVLGGITAPGNTTLNFDFPDAYCNSTLSIYSFPELSLSNLTLTAPNSYIDLASEEGNDPAISLDHVSLNAGFAVNITSYGDGGVAIANSSVSAGGDDEVDIYTSNSGAGISIASSNISGGDGLDFEAGYDSYNYNGAISINSSDLDSGGGYLELYGGSILISNSSLSANNGMDIDASQDVKIQGSDLYSGYGDDYIDIYGANIAVSDSELDTSSDLYFSISGSGGLGIANSSLEGDDYIDIETKDNGGPITIQSSDLFSDGDVDISTNLSTDAGYLGDLVVQSSNITSDSSTMELDGGDSVAIAGNSTLTSQSDMTLTGDAVTVQDSVLQSGYGGNGTCGYVEIDGGHVVTVINSKIVAQTVDLHAADVDGSTLTVNKLNVDTATSISMAARTISLSNVNFPTGSSVNLVSSNGLLAPNPNTNAVPLVNYVNYVTNVQYNSQPAQNFTYVNGSPGSSGSSSSPTSPIQISSPVR